MSHGDATNISKRGVERTGTSKPLVEMTNAELDQLRRSAKHGTTRAAALVELHKRGAIQ